MNARQRRQREAAAARLTRELGWTVIAGDLGFLVSGARGWIVSEEIVRLRVRQLRSDLAQAAAGIFRKTT